MCSNISLLSNRDVPNREWQLLGRIRLRFLFFVGMHPPFATQTQEIKAMAKHCTAGVDFRISHERFILLHTQVRSYFTLSNGVLKIWEELCMFTGWFAEE